MLLSDVARVRGVVSFGAGYLRADLAGTAGQTCERHCATLALMVSRISRARASFSS
jgi:hypothetical protein